MYILTGGGPGATTQFLSLYMYRIAFPFSDLGQASALAVIVMAAMTVFYTVVSRFLPADSKLMRHRLARIVTVLILVVALIAFIFPLYYLIITSLKTKAELYSVVPTLIRVIRRSRRTTRSSSTARWPALLVNSAIACMSATILGLIVALLLCYPITRLPVSRRIRGFVLDWSLSLRFLAPIAVVIPYFLIVRSVGLYNQLSALVLVYAIFNLPLSIWMLKGFLEEIPMEIEEAAFVDGASRLRAFWTILLPLARPGILAAGIVVFAFDWAEFLFAFILTATPKAMTFPVGVQSLVTQFEIIWNEMAAGGY